MNIELGEKLFSFKSKQDWISKAQKIWRLHGVQSDITVCVDQNGRILRSGREFIIADEDEAYPVDVFLFRADLKTRG